jgi:hypothetical protein
MLSFISEDVVRVEVKGGDVFFLVVREGEDIRLVAMLVGCLGTGTVGLGRQELDS